MPVRSHVLSIIQLQQVGGPTSDIAAGSWTTAPLFSKISQGSPDDSTSIASEVLGVAGTTTVAKIGLGSLTDPVSSVGHAIYARAKATFTLGTTASLKVELRQSSTLIATLTAAALTSSFAFYTYTLSSGETDSITDYTALALWITGTFGVGNLGGVQVSWAKIQTPNVGAVQVLSRSITDTAAGADVLTRGLLQSRALSDSASGTDTLTRTLVLARSLSDSASGTDALTRGLTQARTLSDTASGSDVLTRVTTKSRAITDSANGTDVLARALVLARTLTDSVSGSDALTRALILVRALADSASGTDSLTRAQVFSRALVDSAGGSDALARAIVIVRAITNSAGGSDALVHVLVLARTLTDSAGGSDILTYVVSVNTIIGTVTVGISVVGGATLGTELVATASLGESLVGTVSVGGP